MRVQAVIFTIAVAFAALCDGLAVPKEETDVQLTASDADAGNWTANLGDVQIQIEHEHRNDQNANGSWTLGISRTAYEEEVVPEENTEQQTDDASLNPPSYEYNPSSYADPMDYSYKPSMEQEKFKPESNDNDIMTNNIPVYVDPKKDFGDSFSDPDFILKTSIGHLFNMLPPPPPPQYPMYPPPPHFLLNGMYPPPPPPMDIIQPQSTSFEEDSDEVVTDPDDFEYFDGMGWFKLDSTAMDWEGARDACEKVGGHLAVPDSPERVQVFMKLFQRHPEIPKNAILRDQVYVGVNDPQNKRDFTTVQGKPFNPGFPIWFVNEPDNASPGESCVTFHIEGRARDVPCDFALPFFCEKNVPFVI